jgi:hypothetical protein
MKSDVPAILASNNGAWDSRSTEVHCGHVGLLVDTSKAVKKGKLLSSASCTGLHCASLLKGCDDLLSERVHLLFWMRLKTFMPNLLISHGWWALTADLVPTEHWEKDGLG